MSAQVAPFAHLIDESFDEAAFLWGRWEADLESISRNLDEVWSWTEDRLSGALDGVKLAPIATLERLIEAAVADVRLDGLPICAHVLVSTASAEARGLLSLILKEARGSRLQALMRGVEVANLDGSFAPISKLLLRQGGEHAAALTRLKAFRRASLGDEIKIAFESNLLGPQLEAMRAAGRLPAQYAAAWADAGLKHENLQIRLAAMECGLRHRVPNAWAATLVAVRELRGDCAPLLRYVAMLGNSADQQVVFSALGKPALHRAAIWALGHIGSRDAAEHCLLAMKHPKLSRVAGEAYCAITGADLARDRLTAPEPDVPTPDFASDNLDANLVPTAEQQWPLPSLDAVNKHWHSHAARFQEGQRYVRGEPASVPTLIKAVETAPMLRRADYMFELHVRTHGKYDVEARALRAVQRQMMSAGRLRLSETAA